MKNPIFDIIFCIQTLWKTNKLNLFIIVGIQVVNGFLPAVGIYSLQRTLDELNLYFQNKGSMKTAILFLLIQILCLLLMSIFQYVNKLNEKYINRNISLFIKKSIFNKIGKTSYISFEDPKINNNLHVITSADGRISNNISQFSNLLKNSITIITVLFLLIKIHVFLVVILLLGIVPNLILEMKFGNSRYKQLNYLSSARREEGYLTRLLTDKESIKELKLYNLNKYIINKWAKLFNNNSLEEIKLIRKQSIGLLSTEIITMITYAFASLIVIYLIKIGKVLLGSLIAVIQSIQNIQSSLGEAIRCVASIYENSLVIRQYRSFLNTREEVYTDKAITVKNIKKLEIKNLTFSYPNANYNVLKNIDITLTPKKKIAIIGLNGAGKTTLIKCLMGLYPTDSSVFVNGFSLEEIDLRSYYRKISVLFQNFERYQLSLRENIAFGNVDDIENTSKIMEVLDYVGLENFISKLPNHIDNRLGKYFEGGVEPSGGQWQKIAISRSLFRDSDLIILDEPTAALDPKAEVELMEEVFKLYEEKSVIYITHRLGATQLADEILVLKDGQVIERGTHFELLRQNQEYASLYKIQSKWYVNEKNEERVIMNGVF